jgi:ParB family chromosome partitioning protein
MMNPTPNTKSVLGKGLGSLLPPVVPSAPAAPAPAAAQVTNVSKPNFDPAELPGTNRDRHPGISVANVDDIVANEFQPRRDFEPAALEELAQSIRENGLIQPLIVRKNGDKYELIAGERRLRASRLAGLKTVPIVIRRSTDREALELAIVENIQREDLNCVDEALAYFQLMQEFQLSQEELAKRMGKDRATIANALRVLKLSDFILSQLKKGALSRGHAKALLAVEDVVGREKLAQEILEKNYSVRQSEKLAQDIKQKNQPEGQANRATASKSKQTLDPATAKACQDLLRRYMTKVEVKGSKASGWVQIQFGSESEFNRIYSLLMGDPA